MQYLGFADKRVAFFAGLYPVTSISFVLELQPSRVGVQ